MSGNFDAGITKFIVTRRPLQYTHFCRTASENQLLLLLPVIHFCEINLKTMPYTKFYIAFMAVICSAFLHSFRGLALVSAHSQHEH